VTNVNEAYIIRNRTSKTFQAVLSLRSVHRCCLTGTPIQNSVEDFGSLMKFLRVEPFCNTADFKRLFVDPIARDDQEGLERLRRLVQGILLRRTKASVMEESMLPKRDQKIEYIQLDQEERALYDLVKRSGTLMIRPDGVVQNALQTILKLRQIPNHGRLLLPADLLRRIDSLIPGESLNMGIKICEACDNTMEGGEWWSSEGLQCQHQVCAACLLTTTVNVTVLTEVCYPVCSESVSGFWCLGSTSPSTTSWAFPSRPSSKVKALLRNLEADRRSMNMSSEEPVKR
jgi:SNF2 family DNA or RNA helicase